jgi:acetyl esterase/lipase
MNASYEVDIEEVEYLRHGDKPFLARVFKPRGRGPFPAVIEAHGGAWSAGERSNNDAINREVAKGGVVVAALDFRVPPDATYPGSVADVNYGVRWLKANAARFATKPEMVGSMGTSSGGHLVVLAALKPFDPRYAAIKMPGAGATIDARVPYVVTLWPVICPWGRFQDRKAKPAGSEPYQGRGGTLALQERYWLTEEAMAEGSPTLALERGDKVEMPHILYLQHPEDQLHPRANLEQFVANYRKRGGQLQLEFFAGGAYDLIRSDPTSAAAKDAIKKIIAFIHAQTA